MNFFILLLLVGTSSIFAKAGFEYRGVVRKAHVESGTSGSLYSISGVAGNIPKERDGMPEASKQIQALLEAVKAGDKDTVASLFETTEDDSNSLDSFMKNYGNIDIQLQSAQINDNEEIEARMMFVDKLTQRQVPVQWVMKKNSTSPTGWKIMTMTKGAVVDQNSRRNFGSFWWEVIQCTMNPIACILF